ncbi:Methylmalonic aciduria and homocystinuria type D-like protein [Smittium mucronatum]|uniref:Methylmalonic aciduria and homocystinuria type D-like protein n=1 Tax=Smittium mucronatum TaxID=133383 RepID=A0A1R0H939_9FUNG|nr:Methylmalonic aciduria and homocystinuria type D-like protein [Smittium mucronatum]
MVSLNNRSGVLVEPSVSVFRFPESPEFDARFKIDNKMQKGIFEMQYSIHQIPKMFKSEMKLIFPSLPKDKLSDLLIIPTFQKTSCSLIDWGGETQEEKDRKLLNFYKFGYNLVTALNFFGYWADIICPASGLPVFTTSGSTIYSEVDCCKKLLNYSTVNVGMCNVITHPNWGLQNYPASAFTTAPLELVQEIMFKASL